MPSNPSRPSARLRHPSVAKTPRRGARTPAMEMEIVDPSRSCPADCPAIDDEFLDDFDRVPARPILSRAVPGVSRGVGGVEWDTDVVIDQAHRR